MSKSRITLPEGTKIPNHIAVILDGNRRWARAKGLPTLEGHRAGFEAGMKIAESAREWGVHTFTVWGFSTENWDRSKEEISYLMTLYWKMVDEIKKRAIRDGIRFVHLGRKDRFPRNLVQYIMDVEEATKNNTKHVFNVALDYGGHDEIIRATKKIIDSGISSADLTREVFEKYLDTGDQPYPYVDLFIRTSGEQRTSGLLPWQMHYAEYYWELEHLPDMTPEKLRDAVLDYSRRRRRFGGNDVEEHLKFNPKLVASLEVKWRKELGRGGEKFRELVFRYVKEQYGLSKELARAAGTHLASALLHGEKEEWVAARESLRGLYSIVKKSLGLAFEPEIIANFEVEIWRKGDNEDAMREFLGEKFRFSRFQAAKSAHLAVMANREMGRDSQKALGYLEKFYQALKERVA